MVELLWEITVVYGMIRMGCIRLLCEGEWPLGMLCYVILNGYAGALNMSWPQSMQRASKAALDLLSQILGAGPAWLKTKAMFMMGSVVLLYLLPEIPDVMFAAGMHALQRTILWSLHSPAL